MSNRRFKLFVKYYFPPLFWVILIFWLSSIPYLKTELPSFWDLVLRKIFHFLEFGILAYLISRALFEGYSQIQKFKRKEVIGTILALSILYAFLDEFHQGFVAGRQGSLIDVGIDILGIMGGVFIYQKRIK